MVHYFAHNTVCFAHNTIFLSQHGSAIFLLRDIWIDDKSHISDTFSKYMMIYRP
jgi:hypothetical protein